MFLAQQPDLVRRRADAVIFGIAVETLELRVTLGQPVDPVAEGVDAAIARAVDEVHRPLGFQRRFQHGQGRGDADATTDQHQRFVTGRSR